MSKTHRDYRDVKPQIPGYGPCRKGFQVQQHWTVAGFLKVLNEESKRFSSCFNLLEDL